MRAARAVVAGLVVALGAGALAGCRTGEAEPATTPPASVSPTPAATPTPEPSEPEPTEAAPEPQPDPVVNGPNSLTSPLPGATVTGPLVTVTGEGTAFEATLLYRVLAAGTDEVVAEGFTMAGANGEVGPYTFDVTLEPGEYVVQVWEPDMREGDDDGEQRNLVEAAFTVS